MQHPYERAVLGADRAGGRGRGAGEFVEADEGMVEGAWIGARRTVHQPADEIPQFAELHDPGRTGVPRDVPAGTSPDPAIQAQSGSTAPIRSSGWVVASRSRQIRPASKRSSYEAVATVVSDAMCLSPPRSCRRTGQVRCQ